MFMVELSSASDTSSELVSSGVTPSLPLGSNLSLRIAAANFLSVGVFTPGKSNNDLNNVFKAQGPNSGPKLHPPPISGISRTLLMGGNTESKPFLTDSEFDMSKKNLLILPLSLSL
jgi:hypothetical protein